MPKSLVPNQFDYSGVYVEGKRSYFRFNKTHLASFMSGMLVPMGDPIFVIPGAKMELLMDNVIRSNTMVVPPLDGIYIDTFGVWVPHRIVFNAMPQFIGENDQTAWTQSVETVLPTVFYETLNNLLYSMSPEEDNFVNDVDFGNLFLNIHYGLFANKEIEDASSTPGNIHEADSAYHVPINVIPHRGYYAIWNHFFRDENYQRPVLFSKGTSGSSGEFGYCLIDYLTCGGNGGTLTSALSSGTSDSINIGTGITYPSLSLLMPVNKFHDWAQSLLPQAQFGSPVEMSLGGEADVFMREDAAVYTAAGALTASLSNTQALGVGANEISRIYVKGSGFSSGNNTASGLFADLSEATSITINQLRSAVMYQRYLEALGRGGRRVVEFYENIYSVKNSVAAKDYPQMMSHQRFILGVNQVVATADSSGSGWTSHLGDTGAYSLTTLRNIPVCKGEFTEFGYLHILYCVRADNRYSACTPKHFTYKSLLDIYNPYFDHIGDVDMPAFLVNNLARGKTNMGFQEAWWEERSQQGLVVGALNKQYGSLSYWSVGEAYDESFKTTTPSSLVFNPAVFNDIFVSNYSVYPQFIMDCRIHGKTAKRMSLHSVPGIVGRI